MMLVIMLSVVLVASVVSVVGSIDLTVYTLYGYNRYVTGLTPRNALTVDDAVIEKIRALPEMGTLQEAHSYQCMLRTIFGRLSFPIFGVTPEGRDLLMRRCQVRLASGRLPEEGKAEVAVSQAVARNLGVTLGDDLLRPDLEDRFAPIPIRVVGLLKGSVWLGLTSKALVDTQSPLTWSGYLAFAPTEAGQVRLSDALERVVDKSKARVWPFSYLVRETHDSLVNLYLMLDIIVAIVVCVISFVCGLLSNIYFTQRLPEIATLSAIGFTRSSLLLRSAKETLALCVVGWVAGSVATVGLMSAVRSVLLDPRGLLLNATDLRAYAFTAPLPLIITACAVATIGVRLSRLDPVSIIERRG